MVSGFRDTDRFSNLPYLAWKLAIGSTYTLFLPSGSKLSLLLLYGQRFPSGGPFSKLSMAHIWAWNLAAGKSSRNSTYTLLSTPRGWNWAYFLLYRQRLPRHWRFFKIVIFLGMKLGSWQKIHKLHIYSLSTSRGRNSLKLSLLSLYGQRFPTYRQNFKIAVFGHETWQLAKVPEVAHILSFCPRGSKLSLFSVYG